MSYETLNFDLSDDIAVITLDRPDAANSLNKVMAEELFDVALKCEADARAVIVTAQGGMFCSGGDLKLFNTQGDGLPSFLMETATIFHQAIIRFQHMDAPVVMAVNGTAAGAGFSLALTGDYVLAAEEAKFVSAYTASGLTPDGSSTYFIAKHVGLLRAKELVLTNRVLSAEEAVQWGIASKVVPADKLMEEAMSVATKFAQGPTRALGNSKRLLLSAATAQLEAQLDAESRSIAAMARTHDGPHGIDSFANKQKPRFKGE